MDVKKISAVEAISFAVRSMLHHLRLFFFVLLSGSGLIVLIVGILGLINKGFLQVVYNDPLFQEMMNCVGRQCGNLMYQSGGEMWQLVSGNAVMLVISFLILLFVLAALDFGFKKIALDMYDRDSSNVRELFSQWKITPRGYCSWILYNFIISIGFILLVVPGMIALLRFMFFPFFIVDKNAGIIDSLKMSWEATRNHTWDIFACWLAIKIVMYIGFVSWIGVLLTWPLSTLAYAYVYRQLPVHHEGWFKSVV